MRYDGWWEYEDEWMDYKKCDRRKDKHHTGVFVNCGDKHDYTKYQQKQCKCQAIWNDQRFPNVRTQVNICSNCETEGNTIFQQFGNEVLSSTEVGGPGCFRDEFGNVYVTASGTATLVTGGVIYRGFLSIVLIETPGAFDRYSYVFNGTSAAGGGISQFSFGSIPDNLLSITECGQRDCSCRLRSNPMTQMAVIAPGLGMSGLSEMIEPRVVTLFGDGRVVEQSLSDING